MQSQVFCLQYPDLQQKALNSQSLGLFLRQEIEIHGCVLLKNFLRPEESDFTQKFFQICQSVGVVIPHTPGMQDFILQIRPTSKKSPIATFSEHNLNAELHTDSQYKLTPERYFALLMVQPASCGGGRTEVLDFAKVYEDLSKSMLGIKTIDFMTRNSFPIVVPTRFTSSDPCKVKHIRKTIIASPRMISYRYDTTLKGIELIGDQKKLYRSYLDDLNFLIQESEHKISFDMEFGDVLFIDNHRMLHGRSGFRDLQRTLFRVRMN